MTKTVYIVGNSNSIRKMFENNNWEIVTRKEKADLFQFTGGEDVSPQLYREQKHPATNSNIKRDSIEIAIYDYAMKRSIPVTGICRGGQFLHVMNGGKLYQNVSDHLDSHNAVTSQGKIFKVSSTHHQMMRPHANATLLLTANLKWI